MRVRSLGRKYSAHLPQKKTSFCSKEFLGQTVVNPSEDFFSLPCGSIGDLPGGCHCHAGDRGFGVVEGCHDVMKTVKTWSLLLHPWRIFSHPFHPGWCRFFWFFATNNFSSRKKKAWEDLFFLMCVYIFFPRDVFLCLFGFSKNFGLRLQRRHWEDQPSSLLFRRVVMYTWRIIPRTC